MARRPASVVKDLRVLTERWDESVIPADVDAWTLIRAKELIEELPSFRMAPQTKLENTLRAIESLYQAFGCDLRHVELHPYATNAGTHGERNRNIVMAVARIINVHYGVGLPAPYDGPVIKIDQYGEAKFDEEDEDDGTVENTDEPVPVENPFVQTEPLPVGFVEKSIAELQVELKDPKYQNVPPLEPGEKEPF